MTQIITEKSAHPTNVVAPSPGEAVTSSSLLVPLTSLAYRSKYADDRITEVQDARMAADWRRIVGPFVAASPEEVGYNVSNGVWMFGCRSDKVAVSLGFPASAHTVTLVTAGGKSGIARLLVEDNGGGTTMLTVDGGTTVATDPDIWTYDGTVFTRQALAPFAATTQFRTGAHLPDIDRWVYLGNEGATAVPAVYTSDDSGVTWSASTMPATSTERVYSCAYDVANTNLVAVGTDTGGTNNAVWRTVDGDSISGAVLSGTTNVQFVTHSAEEELFMLTSIASSTITSYTSPDGVTWTQRGSIGTLCSDVLGLACDSGYGGNDWRILAGTLRYGYTIFRSMNSGVTWLPLNTISGTGDTPPGTAGTPVFKHLSGHWVCALNDGSDGSVAISSEARIRPQEP